jgi:hypothetical protein
VDFETDNRICVLILHFGKLPGWFELWKHTAHLNPAIDFLVFQDDRDSVRDRNVLLIRRSLNDINELPRMKSEGFHCATPYKVCDVRPVFGYVFEYMLKPYEYWGWGDLDVLYGDLASVLGASFGRFDYISTGRNGQSGPLAFLRNADAINNLWHDLDMRSIITSSRHFAADEHAIVELLTQRFRCDIVFRECWDDLPAEWRNGKLISSRGVEYAIFHFGSVAKFAQPGISNSTTKLLEHVRAEGGLLIHRSLRVTRSDLGTCTRTWLRACDFIHSATAAIKWRTRKVLTR